MTMPTFSHFDIHDKIRLLARDLANHRDACVHQYAEHIRAGRIITPFRQSWATTALLTVIAEDAAKPTTFPRDQRVLVPNTMIAQHLARRFAELYPKLAKTHPLQTIVLREPSFACGLKLIPNLLYCENLAIVDPAILQSDEFRLIAHEYRLRGSY